MYTNPVVVFILIKNAPFPGVLQCTSGAVRRTRNSIIAHVQRSSVHVAGRGHSIHVYIGLFNNRHDTYDKATICLRHTHTHKSRSSAVECVCRCLGSGLLAPSARRALLSQTGAVQSRRVSASLACVALLKRKNVSTQTEKRVYP